MLPLIWHDLGLCLVYASTLGGWAFLLMEGVHRLKAGGTVSKGFEAGVLVNAAVFAALAFIVLLSLAVLNDIENRRIDKWIDEQPGRREVSGTV
jgi:membrane protein implicated in regulation of membrane protease activity